MYLIENQYGGVKRRLLLLFAPYAVLMVLRACDNYYFGGSEIAKLFNLTHVSKFYLYFSFGIAAKMYSDKFHELISNKWILLALFFVAIPLDYLYPLERVSEFLSKNILQIARFLSVYAVFYHYRDYFDKNGIVARTLQYFGKHTLEIYFIHWFLLFKIPWAEPLFASATELQANGVSVVWMVELAIGLPISFFICHLSILIRKLISPFPIVAELCFGPKK